MKQRAAEGKEPIKGKVIYDLSKEAEDILGYPGQMLSSSKIAPKGQTVFWNSCIFNEEGEQIWWGDLNITKSQSKLEELAKKIGKIYVTREQPFRFDGLYEGIQRNPEGVIKFG